MDSRLLSGFGLRVEKASRTGESSPAYNDADGVTELEHKFCHCRL